MKFAICPILLLSIVSCDHSAVAGDPAAKNEIVAQEAGESPSLPDEAVEREKEIFLAAVSLKDNLAAQVSAQRLSVLDKEGSLKWKAQLCRIYFGSRNFEGARVLAAELLPHLDAGEQLNAREILGLSQQALGLKEAAIKSFAELFQLSKNGTHAVRLAGLQLETRGYAEALITIEEGLALEGVDQLTMALPMSESEMQDVSVPACLYNLRGLVVLRRSMPAGEGARPSAEGISEASGWFKKALEISPDFELAKRNLEALTEETGPAAVPPGQGDATSPNSSLDAPSSQSAPGSDE